MSAAHGVLRRLRDSERDPAQPVAERCELCGQPIQADHGHVVDLEDRSLLCSCDPCRLLFVREQADHGRFRAVPRRHRRAADVELTVRQWERLRIPVSVAFVFRNSRLGRLAVFYPGPAGATECTLETDEAWQEILAAIPNAADLADDVEALLLRRAGERTECCLVPIDSCYRLIGRIRRVWRGFDGGDQVREEIDRFFARLHRPEPRPGTTSTRRGTLP